MFFGKYLDRMHDGLILSGATHHVPSAATVGSLVAYVETCAWVVSVESWANTRRGWTVLLSRETVSLGLFGFIFKSRLFLFPWLRSSFSPSTEQSMKQTYFRNFHHVCGSVKRQNFHSIGLLCTDESGRRQGGKDFDQSGHQVPADATNVVSSYAFHDSGK